MSMKNVVYLMGAGATQAELTFGGFESNITMEGISQRVFDISRDNDGRYFRFVEEMAVAPEDVDIEVMMSLFEGPTELKESDFYEVYMEVRKLFRDYLVSEINGNEVMPRLLSSLLYMHNKYGEDMGTEGEKMIGILTINYDNLLEEAFSKVFGGLNCGVEFKSEDYNLNKGIPPLLKLHGSFNWKKTGRQNGIFEITNLFENNGNDDYRSEWMPPSVYKRPSGIYREIWKLADKLLRNCDILRVVGSSLRSEDLALISLLFTSQQISESPFNIELIVPNETAEGSEVEEGKFVEKGIIRRLPFLKNIKSPRFLPVFEEDDIKALNIFRRWLDKKISEIEGNNYDVTKDEFLNDMLLKE